MIEFQNNMFGKDIRNGIAILDDALEKQIKLIVNLICQIVLLDEHKKEKRKKGKMKKGKISEFT